MHNLRFAFRALLKSPGFTAVAVLTIAVAIGANTALFSIFNKLVLHPIDLPDADRIVRIWTNNQERNIVAPIMSVPKFELFRDAQTSFSTIDAATFNSAVLVRDGAEPEQLNSLNVTAGFLPTLGLPLARGRNFSREEDARNGPPVCILGYDIWKTRFGQRETLVGETIMLNGISTTVIGILPEKLPAPISSVQLLSPWPFNPPGLTDAQLQGGASYLGVTARLKPGVTFEQANAEVHALAARYQQAHVGRLDAGNFNELRTWIEEQVGPVRPTFIMLLTAVGFVLLIACANVSSLFLGRLSARHKEIAVRLSMGATRGQLVRQFLTETTVFCAVAALLGVLLAIWALAGLQHLLTNQLPANTVFTLDPLTLGFTIAVSVLASAIIGLVPAWQASRVNLAEVLKDTARGTPGGARGSRFRSFLIVTEVALSVLLLVGSGLLLMSFIRLQSTPAGFATRGIASAFVNLPTQRYATKAQQADFFYQVVDQLKANPQVKSAGVALSLPISGFGPRGVYAVEGRPIPPTSERAIAAINFVTEDYFSLLQIPLLAGRLIQPTDQEKSPGVVIINAAFAKRLFPDKPTAVGQVLLRGQKADIKLEIVGVVGDVKSLGLNTPPPDTMYLPLRQWGGAGLALVVSTPGDPNTMQAVLRSAVAAVDRTQAISFFTTMDSALQVSLGNQRISAGLTGVFAGVALLLSAVGLYSVLAYAVTQRTSEIGIRMALGAAKGQVINLILSQGMRLVAIGLILGLAGSAAGSRLLASLLYEVKPLDPLVFASVTVLFSIVAIFACLLPSLRASRIDPIIALRTE
jgi:predicted permease